MAKNKTENVYIEGKKPKLCTSYCAFLDILGFSERIRASIDKGDGDDLLGKFHEIMSARINAIKTDCDESLLYFKSFTDNVILAHPRFSHDLESEFGFILWSISEFQFLMALKGFFIRGGLSIGPLFVDKNSVYGTALIDAYELESKVAVNPIVVLSDDVKKLVLHHVGYYASKTNAPQNREVWVNSDGSFFINYLSECIHETSQGEAVDWHSLKKHKENIEACLKEYASVPDVFAKYAWLANYHNDFCSSVNRYPGYEASVRISPLKFRPKLKRISQMNF